MDHLTDEGFTVVSEPIDNMAAVKQQFGIGAELQSCHTAIVDGYIIEGHVPAGEIRRLLAERPKVRGLSVPEMPIGSPGMEVAGVAPAPYDVLAFDAQGKATVWASFNR